MGEHLEKAHEQHEDLRDIFLVGRSAAKLAELVEMLADDIKSLLRRLLVKVSVVFVSPLNDLLSELDLCGARHL